MNDILSVMSDIICNNYWIAPLISFLAGILTSVTPCSLSTIPLIIGYVGGYGEKNTKKALKLSLIFALRNVNYIYYIGSVCSNTR